MTNTMSVSDSTNDLEFSIDTTTSPGLSVDYSNLFLSPGELKKEDEKHGNKLRIKTNRKLLFSKKGKYK